MPALFTSTWIREKRSRAYVDETLDGLWLGDVGRGRRDRARVGGNRLELGPSAVEGCRVARANEHPSAGRDVRACDLEPEAVAPSGDDRRLCR